MDTTSAPVIDSSQELGNLTKEGTRPKTRMTSARAVRELWGTTDQAYHKRFKRNALVKGLVDGNRPFDQSKLQETGQQYRANFNNGVAEAYLSMAVTAFYDLFSEVDRLVTVQIQKEVPESAEWTDLASCYFDELLRKDDRFDYNIQLSFHDMVLYGTGPMIWEDQLDWRPRSVGHNRVRIPDGAPANVCDWEWAFIECNYRVDELYRLIADPEKAKSEGYDVEQIRESIGKAVPDNVTSGKPSDWMKIQQWIRNNECTAGAQSRVVRTVRFFYREFPSGSDDYGSISEMLVWLDGTSEKPLFHEIEAYKDWRNTICAFFWDRGDGTAHSVRGLGVKMFHMLHAANRLQCGYYDAALAAMAIKFKSLGAAQSQQLSVTNMGPYQTFQGPFEPITHQGIDNVEPAMRVSTEINQTLNSNLGQYRQTTDKTTGNPRTAFEVNAEIQRQSVLARTQIARFYQQLDELYDEIHRRAVSDEIPRSTKNKWLKLALEYQDRCKSAGIPLELLRKAKVKARRTVGQGSAYMRSLSLGQLFQTVFPVLPTGGKDHLVSDLIASTSGRESVERYNPSAPIRNQDAQQMWEATIENDSLRHRGMALLTPYQNDLIHASEHIKFGAEAANSIQQGGDPMEVLGAIQSVGAHAAKHIARMSGNPALQREVKVLNEQLKQLGKVADEIEARLKQQAQAAQEENQANAQAQAIQQGVDPKTRIKAAEMQARTTMKAQRQQADLALKAQQQRFEQELAARKLAGESQLADAETAAGIQRETAKTASKIRTDRVKTASEMAQEQPEPQEPAGEEEELPEIPQVPVA